MSMTHAECDAVLDDVAACINADNGSPEARQSVIRMLSTLVNIWRHPELTPRHKAKIENLVDLAYRRAFS